MVVELDKLTELRQQMMGASDFRAPLNYFFEHFSNNPQFIKSGKLIQHELIQQVVEKVGEQLFGVGEVQNMWLSEIETHQFIHGTCLVNGHVVNILFFDDIDMGLLGIVMEEDKIMTARFSSAMLSPASNKSFYVPNASNAIH